MVLRGYDRVAVDRYLRGLLEENTALRRDLETGCAALGGQTGTPGPQPSTSPRPQPSPTLQHYDPDAPAEVSVGFRAEQLLRLAERETAEMRTRATRNAEAVEAAARQSAKEQLRVAGKQAEALRSRASEEAARAKKQASQEAARVGQLYRSMKGELRRLAEQLNAEAQRPDPDGAFASADELDSGTASRGGAAG